MEDLILGILFVGAVVHIALNIIEKIDKRTERQTDLDKWEWKNRELLTSKEFGAWLNRRDIRIFAKQQKESDFLNFLVNNINPNEMEKYREMYESGGDKTDEA